MIGGMDKRTWLDCLCGAAKVAFVEGGYAIVLMLIAYPVYVLVANPVFGSQFRAIAGIIFGVYVIFKIVRWTNRRDDPRHTNRPPDTP
jgi:hypothetical protein